MPDFAVDWVDAFTDRPFGGNGCAVVHDAAHLDDETCKAFVRETSLVECTFTGPSDMADLRVRYFVASQEIPFAGHPTVATAAAAVRRGAIAAGSVTFETGAGVIPVAVSDKDGALRVTMRQNAAAFGVMPDPALVAAAVSLNPGDFVAAPQVVSTGLPFCIAVLRDHEALRAARLDPAALQLLSDALGHGDPHMEEPFLVTLGGATPEGDTFSRLLLAPPSPPEDPFTGSATGAMASYLWRNGLIEQAEFTAEQGHDMGRPGQARVRVLGSRDAIEGVEVSGRAWLLMSGVLHL